MPYQKLPRRTSGETVKSSDWNVILDNLDDHENRIKTLEETGGVAPSKQVIAEGTITTDGTEQVVFEIVELINLEGYIDLSNMTEGDTIILKRYVKIKEGGSYKLHAKETYSGVQEEPLIRFPEIAGRYGIKITIQQIAGTYKSFDYQFFKII